jgi:hypothetical protein
VVANEMLAKRKQFMFWLEYRRKERLTDRRIRTKTPAAALGE